MDATITYQQGDAVHILVSPQWTTFCKREVPAGDTSNAPANCLDCIKEFAAQAARNTDWS